MSTTINVSIGDGGLPERNRQQTAANRQAYVQGKASQQAAQLGETQRAADRAAAGLDPATGLALVPGSSSNLQRLDQQPAANRQNLDLRVNVFGLSASTFAERIEDGKTLYDFSRVVTIHPPRAAEPTTFTSPGKIFDRTLPTIPSADDIGTYVPVTRLDQPTISTAGSGTDGNFYTASGNTYGLYDTAPTPLLHDTWRYDIRQHTAYTDVIPDGTGNAYVIVSYDVNYQAERIRTTYARTGTIFNPPTTYSSSTTITAITSTLFKHSYIYQAVECFYVTDTTASRVDTPEQLPAKVAAVYPPVPSNQTQEITAGAFGPFPGRTTDNVRTRVTVSTGGSTFTWAETSSFSPSTIPKAESSIVPYIPPLSRYLGGVLAWTPAAALTLLAGPVTTKTQSEVTPEEIALYNNFAFMESQGFGNFNIANIPKYYIDAFAGADTEGNLYTFVDFSRQRPLNWGDPVPGGQAWSKSPVITPALQGTYERHSNWGNIGICRQYVSLLGFGATTP